MPACRKITQFGEEWYEHFSSFLFKYPSKLRGTIVNHWGVTYDCISILYFKGLKLFSIYNFSIIIIFLERMAFSFSESIDIYRAEERNEKKKQRKRLINFVLLHIEEI